MHIQMDGPSLFVGRVRALSLRHLVYGVPVSSLVELPSAPRSTAERNPGALMLGLRSPSCVSQERHTVVLRVNY